MDPLYVTAQTGGVGNVPQRFCSIHDSVTQSVSVSAAHAKGAEVCSELHLKMVTVFIK